MLKTNVYQGENDFNFSFQKISLFSEKFTYT